MSRSSSRAASPLSLAKTGLAFAILSVLLSLVPPVLQRQQDPAERLGESIAREGKAFLNTLLGEEEPSFQLRFEGDDLWPSLAVVAAGVGGLLGLLGLLGSGGDRIVPLGAIVLGAAVIAWQVWMR
ncbi:MAG: hypothetical protein KDM91_10145 [Verrucomicrobiae bacterium]|nr:hypothetical protein [Verrucomicrobiae bacterium]MCP5540265.1 hypothetical protein [Akkermansiaceae bacterium]